LKAYHPSGPGKTLDGKKAGIAKMGEKKSNGLQKKAKTTSKGFASIRSRGKSDSRRPSVGEQEKNAGTKTASIRQATGPLWNET